MTGLLIIDDDPRIRRMVSRYMTDEGLLVREAADIAQARRELRHGDTDILLLDLRLGDEDGLPLIQEIRAAHPQMGIILVTGRDSMIDKVLGLEMGADDYVTKPFHLRELLARVKTLARRVTDQPAREKNSERPSVAAFDRWRLDLGSQQLANLSGQKIDLTAGEFSLLRVFVEHPQQVLTRERLLDLASGRAFNVYDRSIDTQVRRLRLKIEADPSNPVLVKSVRGEGYLFTPKVTFVSGAQFE